MCRAYGAEAFRAVRSAGLGSPALWPVLRSSYCGGWTGKDARRYSRTQTTPRPAHRVEGEAADARAAADGVVAQTVCLLCRRLVIGGRGCEGGAMQAASLRNSRLPICATKPRKARA